MSIKSEEDDSKVCFGSIEIRSYERSISDNPSVTDGPPIGIGWEFHSEPSCSVDEWENYRVENRRGFDSLTLPRNQRLRILSEAGFTQKEIASAVRNALKVKHQRRQTINNLKAFAMEESLEKMSRKVKSAFRFGKSKNRLFENQYVSSNNFINTSAQSSAISAA